MSLKILPKPDIPKKIHNEYDVITVGSGTVDVFVSTDSQVVKYRKLKIVDDLIAYPLGSKLLINDLMFYVGGGGTNTAVSFSRIGLKTGWIGKIGRCENSTNILHILKDENIDFLGNYGKTISGYSIILDSIEHDRTILTYKGENDNLKFSGIKKDNLKTKWFYFSSMVGESFQTQKKLARYAAKNNIKLAFNPSSYQARLGAKKLLPILRYTNVLVLNAEEALMLLEKGIYEEKDFEELTREIHELGPEIVIITDGSKGAYCSDGINFYKVHPQKVKIVETTGAGDAFASTFLASYIKTKKIEKSLKLALINAQSVICSAGAKNKLLSWRKLLAQLRLKHIKITKKPI